MDQIGSLDAFGEEIGALERDLGQAQAMTTAFSASLREVQGSLGETTRDLGTLERGFSGGLKRAFDGLVFDGMKLSDALKGVGKTIADTIYGIAMKPITNAAGGAVAQGIAGAMSAFMPFANGGSFAQGKVMPFANGGVVSSPTAFPMRGGRGLMGEAGPEAIMPLTRGADGQLGVQAAGGGRPVNVVMNISTPDVQGFQRSQSQIAAQVGRALSRGQRNR